MAIKPKFNHQSEGWTLLRHCEVCNVDLKGPVTICARCSRSLCPEHVEVRDDAPYCVMCYVEVGGEDESHSEGYEE